MYDTVARTGAVYLLTYAEQVVADVIASEFDMSVHADRALAALTG